MKKQVNELLDNFKNELCANCNSKDCDRGIHISMWNKQVILKCVDYSPKEIKPSKTYEVDRYYDLKEQTYK